MDDFKKSGYRKGFGCALILGFILVIIWAILLAFLPDGWWVAAINIGFLIISAIVIGLPSITFFKLYMPP